ncbi:mannan endo-1,4-beta-mannosidase [Bacteroidales bacterium]|nr:mannan endo-1,4-beta-mannosidase [Bacteroidales bacterium]
MHNMNINRLFLSILLVLSFLGSCQTKEGFYADDNPLITENATNKTMALFTNMLELSKRGVMFGHHDAYLYGHSWKDERGRSDVNDVCGSHPAVHGIDFASITRQLTPAKQEAEEARLRECVGDVYKDGGITTVTWHFHNPVCDGGFYYKDDSMAVVPMIIPGGDFHHIYKDKLNTIASFAKSLRGDDGELIPIIFRPYHEYDGDWFWWGVPHHCTKEDFNTLWTFTIDYLKDSMGVNNFIYAISPDCKFNSREEFLEYYPGDKYVDLIGMDNYWDLRPDGGSIANFIKKLKIVSDIAKEKNKLCALTETGIEGIPEPQWWTKTLLKTLKENDLQLSYVMVWRNAHDIAHHHYAPYPGHASEEDFIVFYNDPFTIFQNTIGDMYSR